MTSSLKEPSKWRRTLRKHGLQAAGAAVGGAIGWGLDAAVFGVGGAVFGGIAGHYVQLGADWLADSAESTKAKLAPLQVGHIPTRIESFVGRLDVQARLKSFCTSEGSGTFLMHGLGGCGKSSTLLTFLTNSGMLRPIPSRRSPDAVFVWSFYHGDVEQFFSSLTDYLLPLLRTTDDASAIEVVLRAPLLLPTYLSRADKRIVIVMDGLERIQEDIRSKHQRAGTVTNHALRSLIQHAAQGTCGLTKLLITSRLVIPEIANDNGSTVCVSDLNRLTVPDAKSILRLHKVRGSDRDLEQCAREYNFHAYSIVLLGQLLRDRFGGSVHRRDRIPTVIDSEDVPLGRILLWYKDTLPTEQLRLMQALSVFRDPAQLDDVREVLGSILAVGSDQAEVPSREAAVDLLKGLVSLGLVFADDKSDKPLCDLHPLIRDFFYKFLVNPGAAHAVALEIMSSRQPGYKPTEAKEIEFLVELIFHAVRSGKHSEALRIYSQHLGGYPYLGTHRADHATGSKAIFSFLDQEASSPLQLEETDLARLYTDGALYLKNEGRLEDAITLLDGAKGRLGLNKVPSEEYASLLLNLSGIQLLRGAIADASLSARAGAAAAKEVVAIAPARSNRLQKECLSRLASVLSVSGDLNAEPLFNEALLLPDRPETPPREYAEIRYAWLLLRLSRLGEAREMLVRCRDFALSLGASMIVQRVNVLLARIDIREGDLETASRLVDEVSQWSMRIDLHVFIQGWLARAELKFRAGQFLEARDAAHEGLRHAGDGGFTLEWIDFQVFLSKNCLERQDWMGAMEHASKALNGDNETYPYPIGGAASEQVRYRWSEAEARRYLARARRSINRPDWRDEFARAREVMEEISDPMLADLLKDG